MKHGHITGTAYKEGVAVMGKYMTPGMVAATISGTGIGVATGLLYKGEQLEEAGLPVHSQITGSIGYGMRNGLIGAGIGVGAGGIGYALKKVMGH